MFWPLSYKRVSLIKFKIFWLIRYPFAIIHRCAINSKSRIEPSARLSNTSIGSYSYIGPFTVINCTTVGRYCSIAPGVQIGGMEHPYDEVSTSTFISSRYIKKKLTIIEDDVWIGANSIIKQGVHIGLGAVIGAGSVVTRNIPPFAIAYGNPAKAVKMRFDDKLANDILKTCYWELAPDDAIALLKSKNLMGLSSGSILLG